MSTFTKTPFEGMDYSVFLPWCHPEYHPYEMTFGNFRGPFSILRRCLGGKHVHRHILNYIKEFWGNYKDHGKIVHIPLQEGHEGTGEVILTLDSDLTAFYEELRATGELEKTVLVITSDHGSHMGPYFMASAMGEFEQKLPLLFVVFPQWFLQKYPGFRENLLENEQKLVGHYDTYWTLRHLATLPEFGGELTENFDRAHNNYTAIWDCVRNKRLMENILMFEGKLWNSKWMKRAVDQLYRKIRSCFTRLGEKPTVVPDASSVPLAEVRSINSGKGLYYAENVITNDNAKYWFEDAHQDFLKEKLLRDKSSEVADTQKEAQLEELAWKTLKAPGSGRYLFGRSLLKYSDDRSCDAAGIVRCVCSQHKRQPGQSFIG